MKNTLMILGLVSVLCTVSCEEPDTNDELITNLEINGIDKEEIQEEGER